jgi:transposase
MNPRRRTATTVIPPSKQDLSTVKNQRTQSLREKSDKPSGGQPGHEGVSLEFIREPDKIAHYIPNYCPECGSDLSKDAAQLLEERWSMDIPPVVPETTLHLIHGKQCSCGCMVKAQAPSSGRGFVSCGSNLRTLVSYLNTEHHVPYKRLCEILRDVFNLSVSEGSIHNMLASVSTSASSIYEQIRKRIESSTVVGVDETGLNISIGNGLFKRIT